LYNYNQLDENKCEFVAVAGVKELGNGERLFVDIDDLTIALFNIAGQYYAIADVCSHDDGPLGEGSLESFEIICPRHGARFDVRNGHVLALPAIVDIPAYPVRVNDGQIEIGIPNSE
jgi:3-phenylpropionate/trans-cinnamate dioxygenase ferredoxin subunit